MSAKRIGRICEAANALDGDLIVLLGDYAAGMHLVTGYVHSKDWSKAMSILRAPLGVHAIMGNHNWWEDLTAQGAGGMSASMYMQTRRGGWKRTATPSGWPGSRTSSPRGPASDGAANPSSGSTTSTARWRW
ncbi:putative MPP superfamily phosphohydrolase [Mycoplana sp. BE70]|nr:putative MPP superfamily phosphohydrolase [Mycoplana sp. BE70]